ncbi:MAG: chorismate synthase [Spirochaetia bacterium]|nr:chorismate synthase [Spirochaetia bacterium]MCF7940997.1 chorismate synthase [Spirochaetia bacterium]
MSSNSFGSHITITTYGESHGRSIGVILDGVEAGIPIDLDRVQHELDRRRPGQSSMTTARNESDTVSVESGIFEGRTLGTPIAMIIQNSDQHSSDYRAIADVQRPGHADRGYDEKYGFRDHRGGGRSSGRETAARVAAGAIARQLLERTGITITAYTIEAAGIPCTRIAIDEIEQNSLRAPDNEAASRMEQQVLAAVAQGDSCGGIVECVCEQVPAGLGDPVFKKLDALLSQAVMSIGAVKGIEFGEGFRAARLLGSQNNDTYSEQGWTNHAGGVLGGISTGQPIIFRCAVKPTPSISRTQRTRTASGEVRDIEIHGRHDPCICPRIVPVIEAMAALTILDAWYLQFGRIEP